MRPELHVPRVGASFLEEDSNGWLVTFSDLVLQLFAFVMVAAVLGTGSMPSATESSPAPARAEAPVRAARAAAASEPGVPQVADALSLARFDDVPRLPEDVARAPMAVAAEPPADRQPRLQAVEVRVEAIARAAAADAPLPEHSLAAELESFVMAKGLEEAVQVAVNGGGVTLSISDTIGFGSGSAELLSDAGSVLAEVRGLITARSDLAVEVSGHTDDRPLHAGAFRSNLDLSLARAARVAHELAADDAALTGRIFAAGYGAARPVARNDDDEGRARNRRVELRLVPRQDDVLAAPSVGSPRP